MVGQPFVVKALTRAIERDRVAHSYLFSGPRGVGKTTAARILAKALNCEKGPTPHPCCECSSCLEIARGVHVDVVEMDAASNRGIEEVRTLREHVRYAPTGGGYKIYIIDEAHMLTEPAFNALLKTLEEPPPKVVFILATTEPQKLPLTIRSRCQHFHFKALSMAEMELLLSRIVEHEGVEVEDGVLSLICRAAGGSMRDAQMFLEQALALSDKRVLVEDVSQMLGLVDRSRILKALELLKARDAKGISDFFYSEVVNPGYDPYGFVLELADVAREELLESEGTDRLFLQAALSVLLSLLERMRRHPAPDLLAETELIKITLLPQLIEVGKLAQQVANLGLERPRPGKGPEAKKAPRPSAKPAESERPEVPAGVGTEPQGVWRQLIAKVGEKAPSLKHHLAGLSPQAVAVEGNTLKVNISALNKFAQDMVRDSREKLNLLLSEVAPGMALTFEEGPTTPAPSQKLEKGARETVSPPANEEEKPLVPVQSSPEEAENKPPAQKTKPQGKRSREELLERIKKEPAVNKALSLFMGKIVSLEDLSAMREEEKKE